MARAAYLQTLHPVLIREVPLRWWLLAAALVAEVFGLTLGFDSPRVSSGDSWWMQVTARVPTLIRIAIAFAGALFVLLGPRLQTTLSDARRAATKHCWWYWLVVHFLAFAALCFVLAAVFTKFSDARQASVGGLVLCIALGSVTGAAWFLAMAPLHYWREFLFRERLSIAAAICSGAVAWLAVKAVELYWEPLAAAALFLAEHLLRIAYPNVTSDPEQLVFGTPTFSLRILPQCSGYEGIALISVFLALYLWLFRQRIRFPQALVLFPIGAVAIWLANVLRIAALVAIGTSYSPQLAIGGFHSQAGWLSFTALALGFIYVTHRASFFAVVPREQATQDINPSAAALLAPFIALMASVIIITIVSTGFDFLYPVKILAALAALLWFLHIYMRWDWSWSWVSIGIGAAVFIAWVLLEPLVASKSTLEHSITELSRTKAIIWISFKVIGSVLIVPLVEELAFRGYLLRRLTSADFESDEASQFRWTSFLLSSVAFGLLHERWLAGMLAGGGYALAFYRTRKIGDPVVAHMTTNALIAACVLGAGAWSLWS